MGIKKKKKVTGVINTPFSIIDKTNRRSTGNERLKQYYKLVGGRETEYSHASESFCITTLYHIKKLTPSRPKAKM